MANRKSAGTPRSLPSADEVFGKTVEAVQAKLQKKGMLVGHNPTITVLPVPALSARYLLRNEGLPLSCVYELVGQEASYKSTFAIEILRWHRICGGNGALLEAETKPTPDLRNSVLNWDQGAVRIEDCNSQEEWQSKAVFLTKDYRKRMDAPSGAGRVHPWCIIVDTLTGKASTKTIENIGKEGYARQHYPIEARNIADFMRAYPQLLMGYPYTFVGVNHLKLAKHEDGTVDHNVPGGWALRFQCAAIIMMERVGKIYDYATYKAVTVSMQTLKNSYGPFGTRLHVRFRTWLQEDAPGIHRLHSRFEWWEASVNLITKGLGMTGTDRDRLVPRMQEVCDIKEKAGGSRGKLYYSNRLGVPSSDAITAHDMGMLLETKPDVLADLYTVLNIQRQQFFRPGVNYVSQLEEHAHIAAQADAADDAIRLRDSLKAGSPVEQSVPSQPPQEISGPMQPPGAELDD